MSGVCLVLPPESLTCDPTCAGSQEPAGPTHHVSNVEIIIILEMYCFELLATALLPFGAKCIQESLS
jgi:hypothetical protein